MQPYVLKLDQLGMKDVETVGGKNASLGEMISNLEQPRRRRCQAGLQPPRRRIATSCRKDGLDSNVSTADAR